MGLSQDNIDLTSVGPGTVMGEMMRQYWIPAAKSTELVTDGAPVRLALLGEKLIGFRDSSGKVGIMDHRCPHRCASLFYGRNEEGGIRCIYHGWKFDAEGNCTDLPNLPKELNIRSKIKVKAYKTAERNGLVWVFMGDQANVPELPMLEANLLPQENIIFFFIQRECNWLQALEGDIDTSHFGFLHAGAVDADDVPEEHPIHYAVQNRQPDYHVREADWGTQYAAFRDSGNGQTYWRFANFMFPFWTQQPQGEFPTHINARAWVPMDDTHTMYVQMQWVTPELAANSTTTAKLNNGKPLPGADASLEFLPNTTDWFGRWRPQKREANDYELDRAAQASGEIYSGISHIHMQDQAVTESMGAITDHSLEHLTVSDQMIARTRRMLLRSARDFRDHGTVPPAANNPEVYMGARSGFFLADNDVDWQEAYDEHVAAAIRPADDKAAD